MEALKRKEIKWDPDDLLIIEQGAACLGLDYTSFIKSIGLKAAREAIEQQRRLIVSDEAFNTMMADEDEEPNEAIINLMK